MAAKTAKQIKELSDIELTQRFVDLKAELFNLRFQLAVNQLENPQRIRTVKKEIAVIKTVQRQRQLAADNK